MSYKSIVSAPEGRGVLVSWKCLNGTYDYAIAFYDPVDGCWLESRSLDLLTFEPDFWCDIPEVLGVGRSKVVTKSEELYEGE